MNEAQKKVVALLTDQPVNIEPHTCPGPCERCDVADGLATFIERLDAYLNTCEMRRCEFPNRSSYRAAKRRRHARAQYLIERHDERSMFRALAED